MQMQIKKILIYIYTNDLILDMYNTPFFSPHKTIMCGSLQGSIIYFKKFMTVIKISQMGKCLSARM